MSKPTVFGLSGEAKNFVFANIPLFFNHIKVLFPLLLIVTIVKQAGKMENSTPVAWSMAAVTLFIFACFALAWHRSSLTGPDKAHEVNPVTLKKDDWKFMGLFMLVTGAFGVFVKGVMYVSEIVMPGYGEGMAFLGDIVSIIVLGVGMVVFLKVSFLLPAQSVGVPLPLSDARRASKGMIWPLIATNFIYGLLFIVTVTVYMTVAGMVATVGSEGTQMGTIEAVAVGFVLSIPIQLAALLLVALCITALSRAYQWGIQNNDIIPDVPLKR